MELSKNVIDFEKRSAIKSQVLADFIAGWTESANYTKCPIPESPWQVYCNRAWGNDGAGAMAILISPSRIKQTSAQTILLSMKQCYWGFENCEPGGGAKLHHKNRLQSNSNRLKKSASPETIHWRNI
jgi:hypothetical protein